METILKHLGTVFKEHPTYCSLCIDIVFTRKKSSLY